MHLITLDSALIIAFTWAFPQIKFNTLKRIYNGLRENGLFKFTLPVDRKGRTSLPGARSAEEDEGKRCGTQHRTYRKVKSVTK